MDDEPVLRRAVRALVLDADDRILLVRFRRPDGTRLWMTPGGGIEAGESDDDALRREIAEEVGLHDPVIGPCLWTRERVFEWHGPIRQVERAHLVRVERHDPVPTVDLEAEQVELVRWWTLAELRETTEEIAPTRLAEALPGILVGRLPTPPLDIGV